MAGCADFLHLITNRPLIREQLYPPLPHRRGRLLDSRSGSPRTATLQLSGFKICFGKAPHLCLTIHAITYQQLAPLWKILIKFTGSCVDSVPHLRPSLLRFAPLHELFLPSIHGSAVASTTSQSPPGRGGRGPPSPLPVVQLPPTCDFRASDRSHPPLYVPPTPTSHADLAKAFHAQCHIWTQHTTYHCHLLAGTFGLCCALLCVGDLTSDVEDDDEVNYILMT